MNKNEIKAEVKERYQANFLGVPIDDTREEIVDGINQKEISKDDISKLLVYLLNFKREYLKCYRLSEKNPERFEEITKECSVLIYIVYRVLYHLFHPEPFETFEEHLGKSYVIHQQYCESLKKLKSISSAICLKSFPGEIPLDDDPLKLLHYMDLFMRDQMQYHHKVFCTDILEFFGHKFFVHWIKKGKEAAKVILAIKNGMEEEDDKKREREEEEEEHTTTSSKQVKLE